MSGLDLRFASEVEPERARFAFAPYIPLGAVTVLAGLEGLGKTTWTCEAVARLTLGEAPGDLQHTPAVVFYVTAEDSAEHTLVPRLMAAGAQLGRVAFLEVPGGRVDLAIHLPEIEAAAREHGARLLVLDPLVAALPAATDSHRDKDVRQAIAPLASVAADLDLAALAIMHPTKAETGQAINRINGSRAFTAAARSVLLLGADPEDPDGEHGRQRILAHIKSNVSPKGPALRGRVEAREIQAGSGTVPTSRWVTIEQTTVDAADLLAPAGEPSVREEARGFIESLLADGPAPSRKVIAEGRAAGFSEKSLHRAKADLRVVSEPQNDEHGRRTAWIWRLPAEPHGPHGHADHVDHLDQEATTSPGLLLDHVDHLDHVDGQMVHMAHMANETHPAKPGHLDPDGYRPATPEEEAEAARLLAAQEPA